MTIDRVEEILGEIYKKLPPEISNGLNGGIAILPQCKMSPYAKYNDLVIMGEYIKHQSMGRYIAIYYGSFEKVLRNSSEDVWRTKLEEVLKHEFTHHLESLAGEKGLEKEDERRLKAYMEKVK